MNCDKIVLLLPEFAENRLTDDERSEPINFSA